MSNRHAAALVAAYFVASLAALPAAAQSGAADEPMRTPDGQPHISGIFTFRTLTPLERPAALAGQERLSLEEAAAFEASERTRLNRDLFDPISGAAERGLPAARGGGRPLLQRVLVRAGRGADGRQADVADRRSARRPHPLCAGGAGGAGVAAAEPPKRFRGPLHRPESLGPLHPGVQLRAADDGRLLQQQRPDPAGAGLRRDLQRDGSQRADHPARRAPPRHAAAVDRRLPRTLGRGDAGRRDHELPHRDEPARIEPRHAARRALPAGRPGHRDVRVHGGGPRTTTRARGP